MPLSSIPVLLAGWGARQVLYLSQVSFEDGETGPWC